MFDLADEDLEAVAYFFAFAIPGDDPANADLRRRLVRRLKIWRKSYLPNALVARCGPGFLLISDARIGLATRTHVLRGAEAEAFSRCFGGTSLGKLREMCPSDVPEQELTEWIDRWQADRLVYIEKQSIIALPVREAGAHRQPQTASVQRSAELTVLA